MVAMFNLAQGHCKRHSATKRGWRSLTSRNRWGTSCTGLTGGTLHPISFVPLVATSQCARGILRPVIFHRHRVGVLAPLVLAFASGALAQTMLQPTQIAITDVTVINPRSDSVQPHSM